MQQAWSDEVIAFMHDAMAKSDYYERIAERIAPHLSPEAHVCDAGCGMGGLSMALAPYCAQITAIDHDARVIAYLNARAEEKIEAVCADMAVYTPQRLYDAMAFCLFGGMEQTLDIASRLCCGEVFLVKRDYSEHRFSAGNVRLGAFTAQRAEEVLHERGIPYSAERFTASFGQPFRSLAAAERFFALYNRSATKAFSREEIAAKLNDTGDVEFPYYHPNEKQLCLIRFSATDIR